MRGALMLHGVQSAVLASESSKSRGGFSKSESESRMRGATGSETDSPAEAGSVVEPDRVSLSATGIDCGDAHANRHLPLSTALLEHVRKTARVCDPKPPAPLVFVGSELRTAEPSPHEIGDHVDLRPRRLAAAAAVDSSLRGLVTVMERSRALAVLLVEHICEENGWPAPVRNWAPDGLPPWARIDLAWPEQRAAFTFLALYNSVSPPLHKVADGLQRMTGEGGRLPYTTSLLGRPLSWFGTLNAARRPSVASYLHEAGFAVARVTVAECSLLDIRDEFGSQALRNDPQRRVPPHLLERVLRREQLRAKEMERALISSGRLATFIAPSWLPRDAAAAAERWRLKEPLAVVTRRILKQMQFDGVVERLQQLNSKHGAGSGAASPLADRGRKGSC